MIIKKSSVLHNFKKTLSVMLTAVIMTTVVLQTGFVNASATVGDYFTDSNSCMEYQITAEAANGKNGKVEIDRNNSYLSTVVIPATVTNGGNTYDVTSIGDYAFQSCNFLTNITIPNSVTSIGDGAFANCNFLTNITIPNSVTSIGKSAFNGCSSLTGITIPNNVTSIGNYAFSGCSSFTSITIPDSVTVISGNPFTSCANLKSILIGTGSGKTKFKSIDGVLFTSDERTLISYPNSKGANYTIPASATSIGYNAFYGCSGLTGITIPDSVTSIGDNAFYGCSGLTGITIPDSVTSIGNYAFYYCVSLTGITIPSSVTSIGEGAFSGCTSLTGITIPNNVTSIGNYAFSGCSGLTGITIPDSVTSIGKCAFYKCTSLTRIAIPNSITSIGNYAFCDCSGLTGITIPDSITSIGNYAFYECSGLTGITIPSSVTSIGDNAFRECANLSSIYFDGSLPTVGTQVFSNCSDSLNFNCKSGAGGFSGSGYKYTEVVPNKISSGSGIQNGTITPSTLAGISGETVSLKIVPDAGYTLKAGSLKYTSNGVDTQISKTSFTMPATDVTITGAFEKIPVPTFTSAGGSTINHTPTWSWSDATGYGYYRYKLDGAADWTYTNKSSYTPFANLSDGTHTLELEEMNSAGDWSPSSSSSFSVYTIIYDMVTFDKNGGDVNASPTNVTTVNNCTVTLPSAAPAKTGYTFTGWNTKSDGTGTAFTASTPVTYSITVYAQWSQNHYTVTFDKNGGDADANPTTATAAYNGTAALPAYPKRTGYTFTGWNTKTDGTGTAFTASTPVTYSITVYAQWSQNHYTVTFDKNGGDADANPTTAVATYGSTVSLPTVISKRTGYTFTGWNTKTDGAGTAFDAATKITDNITLYAQWSQNHYTVTFNKNGGDTKANPVTAAYNETVTLPKGMTRNGYTFVGWNTKADGTGEVLDAAAQITGNITVYAKWKQNPPSVSYSTYVQGRSWQKAASSGIVSGVKGKRLEALKITLTGNLPKNAKIIYQAYVQKSGWQKAVSNGAVAGTRKPFRIEGLRFTLSGLNGYQVSYRVYVGGKGWQCWKAIKNGTAIKKAGTAGITGKGLHIEAVQVVLSKTSKVK